MMKRHFDVEIRWILWCILEMQNRFRLCNDCHDRG